MLGLPAGVWADAGKFIAAQLIAANAVEISSPLIRLLILMISAPYITLPAQHADNRTLSTPRTVPVGLLYRCVDLPGVASRALCGFGRKRDQAFFIDERRSVNDGISPKTVR
jgi:hypothetical protein